MRCIRFMRSISQIWGILNPRIRGLAMQRIPNVILYEFVFYESVSYESVFYESVFYESVFGV